jgi:hypothetical protein
MMAVTKENGLLAEPAEDLHAASVRSAWRRRRRRIYSYSMIL